MPFRLLLGAAIFAIMASPATAAGPLQVTSKVLTEQKQAAADGTTRVSLVAAKKVVPGDRVVFVLAYRNVGTVPLGNVVLDNPVPAGITYRAPASGSATPELSVDGTTYGPLASLRVRSGESVRPATADDVRHVRWRVPVAIPAGAHGEFAFQGTLK